MSDTFYGLNVLAKEQYLCVQESFCTHLATITSTYIYIYTILYIYIHILYIYTYIIYMHILYICIYYIYAYITPVFLYICIYYTSFFFIESHESSIGALIQLRPWPRLWLPHRVPWSSWLESSDPPPAACRHRRRKPRGIRWWMAIDLRRWFMNLAINLAIGRKNSVHNF